MLTCSRWDRKGTHLMRYRSQPARWKRRVATALLTVFLVPVASAYAQRTLTLDEALAIAERSSEQIAIAQAGVDRAASNELRAKSDLLPQVNVSGSYDRTFKSEFADV